MQNKKVFFVECLTEVSSIKVPLRLGEFGLRVNVQCLSLKNMHFKKIFKASEPIFKHTQISFIGLKFFQCQIVLIKTHIYFYLQPGQVILETGWS